MFFDYDRIEYFDTDHSEEDPRYDTIGEVSAGKAGIGSTEGSSAMWSGFPDGMRIYSLWSIRNVR